MIAEGYMTMSYRSSFYLSDGQNSKGHIPPTFPSKTRWSADSVKFIFVITPGFSTPTEESLF